MPRVEENGIVLRLHHALTDSECNRCGAQLEWKAEFNDINSPKYTAKHCNEDYIITIDSVKVEAVRQYVEEDIKGETSFNSDAENQSWQLQQPNQQKTTANAELPKYKESLKKKTKLGDGSNIKAEDR
jgi:hypothetical protein